MDQRADNITRYIDDQGKGFGAFVDEVLRGRTNKSILNGSVGLAALDIGMPAPIDIKRGGEVVGSYEQPYDVSLSVTNNAELQDHNFENWGTDLFGGSHPLFDFSAENFTLFGLDFPDVWNQIQNGLGLLSAEDYLALRQAGSIDAHGTPIYPSTLAEQIGLPDLPYGELGHVGHIGMALYDSGRTFQDLWGELAEKYQQSGTNPLEQAAKYAARTGKVISHPDMLHTLAARGTMLTVMGLLHPLGMLVAIAGGYLCAHLVHSFFRLAEQHKGAIAEIENVPVMRDIYNASGVKEWVDRKAEAEALNEPVEDPFEEEELKPDQSISQPKDEGKIHQPPRREAHPALAQASGG